MLLFTSAGLDLTNRENAPLFDYATQRVYSHLWGSMIPPIDCFLLNRSAYVLASALLMYQDMLMTQFGQLAQSPLRTQP